MRKKNLIQFNVLFLSCFLLFGSIESLNSENKVKQQGFSLYQKMRQTFFKLYRAKKYPQAAAVMEKCLKKFPDKIHACAWNLAVSYRQVKKYKKGIKVLKKALKKGKWYNIWAFDSEFFKPYKKYKGFTEIIAMNNKLKDAAEKKSKYQLEVVLPKGFDKTKTYSLFVALHGGGENLAEFKPKWQSKMLKNEFIVAYIQSSQMASMTGYHWQDQGKSKKDLTAAFKEVLNKYPVNKKEILVGGFSSGGYASFTVIFKKILPVTGFVVLCPPIPDDITEAEIKLAKERGIRGTLITTRMDKRVKDQSRLIDLFKQAGLQYQFMVTPDTGHWYPKNLDKKIDLAIRHIRLK